MPSKPTQTDTIDTTKKCDLLGLFTASNFGRILQSSSETLESASDIIFPQDQDDSLETVCLRRCFDAHDSNHVEVMGSCNVKSTSMVDDYFQCTP